MKVIKTEEKVNKYVKNLTMHIQRIRKIVYDFEERCFFNGGFYSF
ncbi:hypothetical protein KIS4809_4905 [Bacillus sp. ZZV12-4809]|nr:hypothetical protein KIS4809_4905 [Bacillus sp. ZZV12-4809]